MLCLKAVALAVLLLLLLPQDVQVHCRAAFFGIIGRNLHFPISLHMLQVHVQPALCILHCYRGSASD